MSNVILFDIDGVLNDHRWCHLGGCQIRQECVDVFNAIVRGCAADCVMISSWRSKVLNEHVTITGMEWCLHTHGLELSLRDVLPKYEDDSVYARSRGVNEWLTKNKPSRFIVIDDLPLEVKNLIRPHPAVGLEPYHVKQAADIFGVKA